MIYVTVEQQHNRQYCHRTIEQFHNTIIALLLGTRYKTQTCSEYSKIFRCLYFFSKISYIELHLNICLFIQKYLWFCRQIVLNGMGKILQMNNEMELYETVVWKSISVCVGFIGLSISASSNMVDHKVTMMLLISEKILSVLFIQARSIKLYCSKKYII